MTTTMRAVVMEEFGGPEVLQVREIPIPTASRGHVLIRVEAFGLNRSELHFRRRRTAHLSQLHLVRKTAIHNSR